MARHEQPVAGPDGWTDWIQPVMTGYKLSCCDCGLVHNLDFRVGRITRRLAGGMLRSEMVGKDFLVQFRVSRNNRSTAQVRRHRGKKT